MPSLSHGRMAALLLLLFLVLANVSYGGLVSLFGYDDVLREPVAIVLTRLHEAGPRLVWAWAGFAWSAVVFLIAAPVIAAALEKEHGQDVSIFTWSGVASGLVQAIGLLRWVFVIPPLAAAYVASGPGSAARTAAEQVYLMLNQYGGVALGEHLGQTLLVIWTSGILLASWKAGRWLRLSTAPGLISLPLWVLAQTELFATVIPGLHIVEAAPYAFMIWMVWLLALGAALAIGKPSAERGL
ncbi:MAG: hypothetical protein CFE28_09915 [Alphaproteobacteria bacterium PA2]|nr:MAG: hypothetical protein CFE28_09915 [Alphaproteobacteria bacterium PA2]